MREDLRDTIESQQGGEQEIYKREHFLFLKKGSLFSTIRLLVKEEDRFTFRKETGDVQAF